jgi:hypothetical protein
VNPIQVWAPGTVDFSKGEIRFNAYAARQGGSWTLAIKVLVRTDLTEDLKKLDVRTLILLD